MTDAQSALEIADRVIQAIAALALPHSDTPSGYVSVSMGVAAVIPSAEHTASMLLQQADTALYQAKTLGRNRAVLTENASKPLSNIPSQTPD